MHHVYVIAWRKEGPSKIGISKDPAARLAGLQCGCPHRLRIYYAAVVDNEDIAAKIEVDVLANLNEQRMCGEWLDLHTKETVAAIKVLVRGHTDADLIKWSPDPSQLDKREMQLSDDKTGNPGDARRKRRGEKKRRAKTRFGAAAIKAMAMREYADQGYELTGKRIGPHPWRARGPYRPKVSLSAPHYPVDPNHQSKKVFSFAPQAVLRKAPYPPRAPSPPDEPPPPDQAHEPLPQPQAIPPARRDATAHGPPKGPPAPAWLDPR